MIPGRGSSSSYGLTYKLRISLDQTPEILMADLPVACRRVLWGVIANRDL